MLYPVELRVQVSFGERLAVFIPAMQITPPLHMNFHQLLSLNSTSSSPARKSDRALIICSNVVTADHHLANQRLVQAENRYRQPRRRQQVRIVSVALAINIRVHHALARQLCLDALQRQTLVPHFVQQPQVQRGAHDLHLRGKLRTVANA